MKRTLFLTSIIIFWLTMTCLLIRKNFFQMSTIQSGSDILPLDLEIREEYNAILMGKERIGFNFTLLEAQKDKPQTPYALRYQNYLSFLFLGHKREILIRGSANLDKNLKLQDFDFKITSLNYGTRLSGKIAGNHLTFALQTGDEDPKEQQILLPGPVYFSESIRFIWTPENLVVGKQGNLFVWNPLLGNIQKVQFHVKEKTFLEDHGKKVPAFLVIFLNDGIETRSWVSPEGIVLREEGSAGVTLVKEEGWEIFDAMRKTLSQPPDLPSLFSIPSNEIFKNPQGLSRLKVKIKNNSEEKILELTKQSLETFKSEPYPISADNENFQKELASDIWIESDAPEIKKTAADLAQGNTTALEVVKKICAWVHQTISPVPSMSVPQARMVLSVKKGDCNEYSVLFTALMRALKIPCKMVAGLVYQDGRFYYHAWSEVYLTQNWLVVDPTFNQLPADVTHIPLSEGNLEEQTNLVKNLGQVHLQILEAQ